MEEQRIIKLDKYEYGIVINALNEFRTKLIREKKSTEVVNELLLKLLNIPVKRKSFFQRERIGNER